MFLYGRQLASSLLGKTVGHEYYCAHLHHHVVIVFVVVVAFFDVILVRVLVFVFVIAMVVVVVVVVLFDIVWSPLLLVFSFSSSASPWSLWSSSSSS